METVLVHQKGAALKATGKLGDVMQESTQIALTVAKNYLNKIDSKNNFFDEVK